nr:MAG TPA: hypothetical protein [Caudoviricetes sp.]
MFSNINSVSIVKLKNGNMRYSRSWRHLSLR